MLHHPHWWTQRRRTHHHLIYKGGKVAHQPSTRKKSKGPNFSETFLARHSRTAPPTISKITSSERGDSDGSLDIAHESRAAPRKAPHKGQTSTSCLRGNAHQRTRDASSYSPSHFFPLPDAANGVKSIPKTFGPTAPPRRDYRHQEGRLWRHQVPRDRVSLVILSNHFSSSPTALPTLDIA